LRVGFPLLLFGVLTTVLGSIDKIMIARMMGVTFVGYYSIANMAQNYLYGATNNFSIVAMPKLLEAYGKQQDLKQVKKFVTVSAEVVSYLLPSLLGAIFLITPLFIAKVLPKFIPGIAAMQVLLLDIFFRSCSPQASHFLVALGKQLGLIPITAAAIALSIFFNFIFIRSGLGIAGAALGVSLSSLFATVLTLIYAMKQFANFKEIAAFILKIIFPLAYICTVVLSSYYFINISNPYIRLAVNLLILSAASLPLFFYIDRRTHVVRSIINLLKVKSKIEDAG
jgi:O-antigen/teichoic acid export membrane protein